MCLLCVSTAKAKTRSIRRILPTLTAASIHDHPLGGFKDTHSSWQVIGTSLQTFHYDGLYRLTASTDADSMLPPDPPAPLRSADPTELVSKFQYDSLDHLIEEEQFMA